MMIKKWSEDLYINLYIIKFNNTKECIL